MSDRNLTAYPDNKFPTASEQPKKKVYAPPTQKPINEVVSSFSALDVVTLADDLYKKSGLLIRGNVFHDLYDPTIVNPESELVIEQDVNRDIKEFDYKSLSYEEKKLLLERLMKAEEDGFSSEEAEKLDDLVVKDPTTMTQKLQTPIERVSHKTIKIRKSTRSPSPRQYHSHRHSRPSPHKYSKRSRRSSSSHQSRSDKRQSHSRSPIRRSRRR